MKRALAVAALVAGLVTAHGAPVAADPVSTASASAFGASVVVADNDVVPPTPQVEATMGQDASETTVDVPADPVAVNGTLNADAAAHGASDIESALTVVSQDVDGPYNASGVALIEGLDAVMGVAGEGVSLASAAAVRAEAVAVCRGGTVSYSATSEIIDLDVAGNDIPANAPATEIADAISEALVTSGLSAVVDVGRNVVTPLDGGGIAVSALVITVAADAGPLVVITIGHAEVGAATCGAAAQCADGADNADPEDTLADADDPGCHTDGDAGNPDTFDPADDDETDGGGDGGGAGGPGDGGPGSAAGGECSDGIDNADPEDAAADADDPDCHTDHDATNAGSYDPDDPSELAGTLPRTGGSLDATLLLSTVLGAAGVGLHLLRRRLSAS